MTRECTTPRACACQQARLPKGGFFSVSVSLWRIGEAGVSFPPSSVVCVSVIVFVYGHFLSEIKIAHICLRALFFQKNLCRVMRADPVAMLSPARAPFFRSVTLRGSSGSRGLRGGERPVASAASWGPAVCGPCWGSRVA